MTEMCFKYVSASWLTARKLSIHINTQLLFSPLLQIHQETEIV